MSLPHRLIKFLPITKSYLDIPSESFDPYEHRPAPASGVEAAAYGDGEGCPDFAGMCEQICRLRIITIILLLSTIACLDVLHFLQA